MFLNNDMRTRLVFQVNQGCWCTFGKLGTEQGAFLINILSSPLV